MSERIPQAQPIHRSGGCFRRTPRVRCELIPGVHGMPWRPPHAVWDEQLVDVTGINRFNRKSSVNSLEGHRL